jgi:hypothetical protein
MVPPPPFHISTYASEIALKVVLGKKEYHSSYAIYFIRKNLSLAELNCIVTKKVFVVVVHVIKK